MAEKLFSSIWETDQKPNEGDEDDELKEDPDLEN
jgi:hypothetical protein